MIECPNARDLLLTAEPAELQGEGESALARHLISCLDCRMAAKTILVAQHAVATELGAMVPRAGTAQAISHAAPRARRRVLIHGLTGVTTLAAAATLVVAVLSDHHSMPKGALPALRPPMPLTVSVASSPGRDVVVMHTRDPKIVVIWYLPSRRSL